MFVLAGDQWNYPQGTRKPRRIKRSVRFLCLLGEERRAGALSLQEGERRAGCHLSSWFVILLTGRQPNRRHGTFAHPSWCLLLARHSTARTFFMLPLDELGRM